MLRWMVMLLIGSLAFAETAENDVKGAGMVSLYVKDNDRSEIIAQLTPQAYKNLKIGNCKREIADKKWCEATFSFGGVTLSGWVDKKQIKIPKTSNKNTFERQFGGRRNETGHSLLAMKDGGFLIVGTTETFGAGQNDIYAVRVDAQGNKLWSQTYGGQYEETAGDVAFFGDGIMIVGSTRSFGGGLENVYVVKIRENGNLVSQNGIFYDEDDRYTGVGMAPINEDHMMIVGTEDHVAFFNSELSIFLCAVDKNGNVKWQTTFGGDEEDYGTSIVRTPDGFIVGGATESYGAGDLDAYLVRLDDQGNRAWHNVYGWKRHETIQKMIVTRDGNLVFVGTTESFRNKMNDVYVAKVNGKGERIWHHTFGGRADDEGFDIKETDDGFVVVGYTESSGNGGSDIYLLKLDRQGERLWQRTYGSDDDDIGRAVTVLPDGYAIAGTIETGNSDTDMYLLKVDKDGNLY